MGEEQRRPVAVTPILDGQLDRGETSDCAFEVWQLGDLVAARQDATVIAHNQSSIRRTVDPVQPDSRARCRRAPRYVVSSGLTKGSGAGTPLLFSPSSALARRSGRRISAICRASASNSRGCVGA